MAQAGAPDANTEGNLLNKQPTQRSLEGYAGRPHRLNRHHALQHEHAECIQMAKGFRPIIKSHNATGVHSRINKLKNEEAKFTAVAMGKMLVKRKYIAGQSRTRKVSKLGTVVHTCVSAKPSTANANVDQQQSVAKQAVGVYNDCISAAVTPKPVNLKISPVNRRILQLQKFEEEFIVKEGSRPGPKPVAQPPAVSDIKPVAVPAVRSKKKTKTFRKKNKENSNPQPKYHLKIANGNVNSNTPMKAIKEKSFTPKKASNQPNSWKVLSSAKKLRTTKSLHTIGRGGMPAVPVFIDQF